MNDKYEVIKFEDGEFSLDVSVDPSEDTVWLTQKEIAALFEKDENTINEHINNIFANGEIDYSTSTGISGKSSGGRKPKIYNLDVILAVGYRVNSKRGVLFRRWATSVLKQYMLQGYSINNQRCLDCQSSIVYLENEVRHLSEEIRRLDIPEKLVYENELIDAYTFIRKLLFTARREIVIIDNYADSTVIDILRGINLKVYIIGENKYLNRVHLEDNIHLISSGKFHDRFIITDEVIYHIGTSFNDIGKKRFTIMKVNDITKEMLLKGCDIYE